MFFRAAFALVCQNVAGNRAALSEYIIIYWLAAQELITLPIVVIAMNQLPASRI